MPISPQMTAFDMWEQHLYSELLISPMLSAATLQSKLTLVACIQVTKEFACPCDPGVCVVRRDKPW